MGKYKVIYQISLKKDSDSHLYPFLCWNTYHSTLSLMETFSNFFSSLYSSPLGNLLSWETSSFLGIQSFH